MIYDKIDNFEAYCGISNDIKVGLDYLRALSQDVENGVHVLTPCVKAIVSEYTTKEVNENGFEAHREFIDIQYLIRGSEIISSLPLEYLSETKKYNEDIDAAFFEENSIKPQKMRLGNGYFAIFFPQDGHMPCLSIDEPEKVKKVVVKVKCL